MSAMVAEVYMEEGLIGLEPRVARIESEVAIVKETVVRLDDRVDRLDAKLDERFQKLDGTINSLDKRMVVMEHELGNVRESQGRLHGDLRDLYRSLDGKFTWIVTTMFAFGTALLIVMAKGFHWLD